MKLESEQKQDCNKNPKSPEFQGGKHVYVRLTKPLLTKKNILGRKSLCKGLIGEGSSLESEGYF